MASATVCVRLRVPSLACASIGRDAPSASPQASRIAGRRDLDNLLKAVLDLLVMHKVIKTDADPDPVGQHCTLTNASPLERTCFDAF
jgi:hypothetical protein